MTLGEAAAPAAQIGFSGGGAFYTELRQRVAEHVNDPIRSRIAHRQLYTKTAVIILWAAGSWAGMMFFATAWWQVGLLAVSLGLAVAGIGFNVTHDANHGSYSKKRWLNRSMRWSLDVIGASSYIWRIKHNVIHHTYTNVSGADNDIEQLPFLRLAPDQPPRRYNRYQHIYALPLYAFFSIKMQLVSDFGLLKDGQIEGTPLPWPKGKELVGFWLGKVAFATWAIALPLLFHPPLVVLFVFLIVSGVLAVTVATTFQLAHCVEEAEFTTVDELSKVESVDWARHQVETTVDFAPSSRLLAWYMGGLNFQIEHHLFTRVPHTHYPQIAPIVRETCEQHGITYQVHQTLGQALMSHMRWLRRMGTEPQLVPQAA